MGRIIYIGTDSLMRSVLSLYERGEISKSQYKQCLQRNKSIDPEHRTDVIRLTS